MTPKSFYHATFLKTTSKDQKSQEEKNIYFTLVKVNTKAFFIKTPFDINFYQNMHIISEKSNSYIVIILIFSRNY